ncbi:MAG TPA: FtsX-like permease family protein [Micromonosporaceae bacterium]
MTTTLDRPAAAQRPTGGGGTARRAVVRWAWRLFRREWRQQLLILVLIAVAVGATIVGSAVASDSPPPANAGFGTASYAATFAGADPHLAAEIATLRQKYGSIDVIENQTLAIPSSVDTYDVRAQDPRGAFGTPMLRLVSGRYPAGAAEVALTSGLAKALGLTIGDEWRQAGQTRRVVGIVQNPQSLLDAFALVAPGQLATPTRVTVLFDAPGVNPSDLGPNADVTTSQQGLFNPETIVLAVATVFMLLIGLVSVAGFTVLAQRRLRSIGMLGAVGATDKNIRLVVRANGVIVGVIGTVVGAVVGFALWFAYRPKLENNVHHVIGAFQVPWVVIGPAMGLAVVTTYLAASRPAKSITKVPIVTALSGRPATPKRVHRSALPGIGLFVAAFLLLTYAGSSNGNGSGALELVLGFVALIAATVLLAPTFITVVTRFARRTPIAVRLAIRDLARYRARSGSSLAAISVGVFIAVLVCVATAARYSNPLDFVGPNLSSTQMILHLPGDSGPGCAEQCQPPTAAQLTHLQAQASAIAHSLGSHNIVELDATNATLQHAARGRNYSGPLYVATPQLLKALGISSNAIHSDADIATMRPGLSSTSLMQLVYGHYFDEPPSGPDAFPCPQSDCLANPKMQQLDALPSGTSAPNTVITEYAVHKLGLAVTPSDWLIQTAHPLSEAQIASARQAAAAAGMSIETKSQAPTSAEVVNWATAAGILLALGILAMTVGLIRAETARDLRTLIATGAAGPTRRTITAATAGTLALLGGVLGTISGYVAAIAWFRSEDGGNGLSSLSAVPTVNLLIILIGMPLAAAAAGWLLSGRQPPSIAHQPIE